MVFVVAVVASLSQCRPKNWLGQIQTDSPSDPVRQNPPLRQRQVAVVVTSVPVRVDVVADEVLVVKVDEVVVIVVGGTVKRPDVDVTMT